MAFNSNLIIAWTAKVNIGNNSSKTITFPITFNAVFGVYATVMDYNYYYNHCSAGSVTVSGCNLRNYRSSSDASHTINVPTVIIGK